MEYVSDKEKIEYCKKNKHLEICKCIFPPEIILNTFKTNTNPYYCYYEKCKKENVILTSLIEEEMKKCTVTNCIINIGDLEVKGSTILIKNKCLNELDISNYFKVFDINLKTDFVFNIPILVNINYFIIIIILSFFLINIKY